jgi:deoxyribose-phosphate aldolase
VAQARTYLCLAETLLGPEALTPERFRIGASSLLDDIEALLAGRAPPPAGAPAP